MKTILFLCESLGIGGAEKALYTLLSHIDKSVYRITVCTLCDIGYYSDLVKKIPNIKYHSILNPSESWFKSSLYKLRYLLIYRILSPKLIYKFFIPKNNDIEIAFCEGFSTKILANSNNKSSKKIAWVHTDLLKNNWPISIGVYKTLTDEILSYSRYDRIVGVSNSVTNNLNKLFKHKFNVQTIYNLIDVLEINKLAKVNPIIKQDISTFNIVSVGRLEYVKGYDRLITVCARLILDDNINITLTIVGDGNEYKNLSEQIKRLSLENRVQLVGVKNNPYPYILNADLYVCPSRQEGYNLALAEAIILGKPCASTNCSGPDEILDNGRFGMLVDNDDIKLYEALKFILRTPSFLQELKEKAIERTNFFSVKKNIDSFYQLIES